MNFNSDVSQTLETSKFSLGRDGKLLIPSRGVRGQTLGDNNDPEKSPDLGNSVYLRAKALPTLISCRTRQNSGVRHTIFPSSDTLLLRPQHFLHSLRVRLFTKPHFLILHSSTSVAEQWHLVQYFIKSC